MEISMMQRIYSKLPVLSFDISAIPVAWYLSYWLQNNLRPFPRSVTTKDALAAFAILSVIQIACYYHFKVYRGLWKFSSLNDVRRIIQAVISAVVLVIPILYMLSILPQIPRSILPMYGMLLVMILCGGRLLMRTHWDKSQVIEQREDIKRILIIGAGLAGESLLRDLNRSKEYFPVGLIDDDRSKFRQDVRGISVLGNVDALPDIVKNHQIDLIFIAIPSARSIDMRRIVSQCESCHIPFRTLPSLLSIASGRVEVNALREVHIEDLLGRDQVKLNWEKISHNIQDKRILVTGAGGSIGSELCRQIMALKPKKIMLLDNCEYNLYQIDLELKERFSEIPVEIALISVVDVAAMDFTFQRFNPEIVFHAAAYKHVPLLENQIREAVQNNILGTQIAAEASVATGALKFILISSDKAVNPTNIMGTTKRVAEIYCQNLNEQVSTDFITVRFGNVLGSVGSVVPLFQKQLQKGGPLTVTHPDIERYFMTIAEACQLILQAMANGEGGEIFVLDMGEPIKLTYLAEQMIRLAGKEPGKDIAIEYTGLRPGEKLYEELFHASELLEQTSHEKLFKSKFRQVNWNELIQALRLLNAACKQQQTEELLILLKNLVPEFSYDMSAMTKQMMLNDLN